jgi:putative transposase
MGRQPRLQIPGGLYHVTTRGNCGAPVFADALDRLAFLDRLGSSVVRFDWKCFAYCLMGNHFHLLIETPDANIARGMRALNGWYAQRFNWRHERTGHLFEAPYHAELIEREAHLLETTRYIVLNPVRAKLCQLPHEWRWSSYRSTAGLDPGVPWLSTGELLRAFSRRVGRARQRYRSFVEEAAHPTFQAMSRDQVRGHVFGGPGSGPGPRTRLG